MRGREGGAQPPSELPQCGWTNLSEDQYNNESGVGGHDSGEGAYPRPKGVHLTHTYKDPGSEKEPIIGQLALWLPCLNPVCWETSCLSSFPLQTVPIQVTAG